MSEFAFQKGRYTAEIAGVGKDLRRALALRARAFRASEDPEADRDAFDARCNHVTVTDRATGRTVCAFRLMALPDGSKIDMSYAAQFYDLSALSTFSRPMAEVGRFCIAAGCGDPDILRVAWGALTRHVDASGVGMLFGCSSFSGTEPQLYGDAFAMLRSRHLAPEEWRPKIKATRICHFDRMALPLPDAARAARAMPPLLRTYLTMGGWVSDHAVVDEDLGTLHVFTGVEIAKVPANRARLLRAIS